MREHNYKIFLETPLGSRKGVMHLYIDNAKVNGYLDLLGQRQPISGEINEDGNCSLSGRLKTLVSEFSYKATGYINDVSVDLIIVGGQNSFIKRERSLLHMTGQAYYDIKKGGEGN